MCQHHKVLHFADVIIERTCALGPDAGKRPLLEIVEVAELARVGLDGGAKINVDSDFLGNFISVTESLVVDSFRKQFVEVEVVFH